MLKIYKNLVNIVLIGIFTVIAFNAYAIPSFYSITPAPNTVDGPVIEKLLPIDIYINNETNADPDIPNEFAIKIYKDDNFSEPYATPYAAPDNSYYNHLWLNPTENNYCDEPGKYTVVFPAGAYTWQGEPNEEFELVYYVGDMSQGGGEEPEPEPEPSVKLECTPDPSIPLASLSEFSFIISEYSNYSNYVDSNKEVVNENGDNVATASVEQDVNNPKNIIVTLSQKITKAGTYTISFNEGDFKFFDYSSFSFVSIPAFEITYTVDGSEDSGEGGGDEPSGIENPFIFTPDPSVAQTSLKEISFYLNPELGYEYSYCNLSGTPTFDVYFNDEETPKYSVTYSTNWDDVLSTTINILTFDNQVTENGTYTIKFNEGDFICGKGSSMENTAAFTITYTIEGGSSLPEVVYDLDPISIDPEDNAKINSFSSLKVKAFADGTAYFDDSKEIKIYNSNDEVVGTGKFGIQVNDHSSLRCDFGFGFNLTEPGVYTVEIPQGAFGDQDWSESGYETGHANKGLTYTYTIVAPTTYDYPITLDKPNAAYASLDKFEIWVDDVNIHPEKGTFQVINADTDAVVAEGVLQDAGYYSPAITCVFNTPITEAGNYTVIIPQGAFGDNTWVENNYISGKANAEIRKDYAIGVFYDFEPISITPENNANVSEISAIEIKTDLSWASAKDNLIWVYDAEDNAVVSGTFTTNMDDYSSLICTFPTPVIELGTYTVVIPQGTFGDDTYFAQNYGHANAEIRLTYTVTIGTGIDGINAGTNNLTVYSIDGVCVLRNAKADDLKNLEKGLYIVNGKKMVIR